MGEFMSLSFLDGSQESASLRLPLVTGASLVSAQAIITKIQPLSSMLLRSWEKGISYPLSAGLGYGAREMKILVRCHDSQNDKKWSFSIPGFATGIDLLTGTDFLDLNDTEAGELVTALESIVATPWYDNAIVVDSMERTRGRK